MIAWGWDSSLESWCSAFPAVSRAKVDSGELSFVVRGL